MKCICWPIHSMLSMSSPLNDYQMLSLYLEINHRSSLRVSLLQGYTAPQSD